MLPAVRIKTLVDRPPYTAGQYVLYWMTAFRRLQWNFALDHAVGWCRELRRPLLILEALECDYPWASDRIHRFVLEGMAENRERARKAGVAYHAYVEPRPGAGRGLLRALARRACVVVSDDYPCFFLPAISRAAAKQLRVRFELVDSNGLLPLRAAGRAFDRAFSFRRFLQRNLPERLEQMPLARPFARLRMRATNVPQGIAQRWPAASNQSLRADRAALERLPINHNVGAAPLRGGTEAARKTLRTFLAQKLATYDEKRNHPDVDASSHLSAYLHFGHISTHEVFSELMRRERWSPARLALRPSGSREGWWGVKPAAEAFLDQVVTWRELGFNFCVHRGDYAAYDSLPTWARRTLAKHARDERAYRYTLEQLEKAQTHDRLWNAAQRQLSSEGRLHNYMRMLWGKKILEWTRSPRQALAFMIELNNKYALDGRDPNSYSGILWCLGRYDRPWGPERPTFGTVRYMSSENTGRKLRLRAYLMKYA